MKRLKKAFERERSALLFCLIAALLFGLAAHMTGFVSTSFSHDSLNAIYADSIEVLFKIELGRFIVPVYEFLTRGFLAIPWTIGLLALIYMGLSLFILVKMFDVKSRPVILLMAGVLTVNISFIAQTATFIHELDCNCLAFLLSVAAAYLWQKKPGIKGLSVAAVLLFLAMGIYQSFVSVAIALIMFLSILELFRNEDAKKVLIKALKGVAVVAIAVAVYYVVSILLCKIFGVAMLDDKNVFVSQEGNLLIQYAKYLVKAYYYVFATLADFRVYNVAFIVPLFALTAIVLAFVVLYIFKNNREMNTSSKLLVLLIIAIMPLGMNISTVFSRGFFHDIMAYPFHLVYIMLLVALCRFEEKYEFKYKRCLKYVGMAIVAVLIVHNISIANMSYQKKAFEEKATLSLMTRVVDRLEEKDEFRPGETPVAFVGVAGCLQEPEVYGKVKYIAGMSPKESIALDTSIYYYNTYKKYFTYILKYPMEFCDYETHELLKKNAEVEEMPAFPDKDCMKMVDGVMVVKMAE